MTNAEANEILSALFPGRASDFFGRFAIGSTAESKNAGANAILDGRKIATSSLEDDFEDGRLPRAGSLSVLEDATEQAKAVIETTSVQRIRFQDVPSAFAKDYGEGDGTLAWFQNDIGAYYRSRHPDFSGETLLVWEVFRVVHRFA